MKLGTLLSRKKKATEVFTPRSPEVNDIMYLQRSGAEKKIITAISINKLTLLIGETGIGKTWTLKRVLEDHGLEWHTINFANLQDKSEITQQISSRLQSGVIAIDGNHTEQSQQTLEPTILSNKAGSTSVGSSSSKRYKLDPIRDLLDAIDKRSSKITPIVFVFENFEMNPRLELYKGLIAFLIDTEQLKRGRIKLFLTTASESFRENFSEGKDRSGDFTEAAVFSRVHEIKPLYPFNLRQIMEFSEKGFNEQLKLGLSKVEIHQIASDGLRSTLGIPSDLHDYCLILANLIIDKHHGGFDYTLLKDAGLEFYSIQPEVSKKLLIKSVSNDRAYRRNQTLFCCTKIEKTFFSSKDIKRTMKIVIGHETSNQNIKKQLVTLCNSGLLIPADDDQNFRWASPTLLMAARQLLYLTNSLDVKIAQL